MAVTRVPPAASRRTSVLSCTATRTSTSSVADLPRPVQPRHRDVDSVPSPGAEPRRRNAAESNQSGRRRRTAGGWCGVSGVPSVPVVLLHPDFSSQLCCAVTVANFVDDRDAVQPMTQAIVRRTTKFARAVCRLALSERFCLDCCFEGIRC